MVSVTEPLDDTTPAGKFIESVLASVAQFDNDVRRERVTAGMKAATSDGRFPHKGPLGYLNGSKKKHEPSLLPDPSMGPLVRQAFEAIDVGEQPNDVRRAMEKRGLVGPSGRLMPGTFYRLLSNSAYVGLVETKLGTARGDWQPLIDEALFHRVQARLRRTAGAPRRPYSRLRADFALRGLVKCSCGRRLTGSYSTGKSGRRFAYYHCRPCRVSYPVPKLDAVFIAWLDDLKPMPGFLRLTHESIRRVWAHEQDTIVEQRRSAQRQVEELTAQLERLHRRALLDDNAFDPATVRRLREDLEDRRLVAETALHDLACDALDVETVLAFAEHVLTNAARLWAEATPEQRTRLGAALFPEGVTFDGADFKTPLSAFQLSELRGPEEGSAGLVDQRGFEPLTS